MMLQANSQSNRVTGSFVSVALLIEEFCEKGFLNESFEVNCSEALVSEVIRIYS